MSALVWSVESVVIGLWALVFVQFVSNPFHTFVARAQLIVAGATLLMQLINSARVLAVAPAISEAYVCAVSGLFLVYLMVLFDADNYSNPKFFSMGTFGNLLPIDACVALGWFGAALISGIGMALSERGRPSALMFHHFGYHILIVPPSFLVFWLYNYDGTSTSEPLSQAVRFLYEGARITHFIYTMLLICIWGVFIVLQATGEFLQFGTEEWPSFSQMTTTDGLRYGLSVLLKLLGRCACILIPLSAAFTTKTTSQAMLAWALVAVGAANAFDWLQIFDRLLSRRVRIQHPPPLESSLLVPNPNTNNTPIRNFDPAALPLRQPPPDAWRDKSV
jgi:hypothetical protein